MPLQKKFHFTIKKLEEIKPPKQGQIEFSDAASPLRFRVSQGGGKSYTLRARYYKNSVNRTLAQFKEISLTEAREKAVVMRKKLRKGSQTDESELLTVRQLVDRSIKHTAEKASRDRKRKLAKYYDVWNTRIARSVTPTDVRNLHTRITKQNGPSMANIVVKSFRSIYTPVTSYNPCKGVKLNKLEARDRFLNSDELPRFFKACKKHLFGDYFKLLLFTGGRSHNVREICEEQIDRKARLWQIPKTKTGSKHVIPLVMQALPLINCEKLSWHHGQWVKLCEMAELTEIVPHDLRHTLSTWMDRAGASQVVCARLLGHKIPGMTARYTHTELKQVRHYAQRAVKLMLDPKLWEVEQFGDEDDVLDF